METQILGKQIEDATIVPSKISINPADNFVFPGAVGVGVSPVASAMLQADSTTKGFLAPRMTTTQRDAIVSPATGLQIYNTTTTQMEVYNGAAWTGMGGSGTILTGGIAKLAYYPSGGTTIDDTAGLFYTGSKLVIGSGSALNLESTSNQISFGVVGLTNILTVTVASPPTTSQTYTIPYMGAVDSKFLLDTGSNVGPVGIGEAPLASSLLDVASTTKGFLPPRMTTTQKNAISSPATGLIVYDTTLGYLQEYNGTIWTSVSPVTSAAGATTQIQYNNAGAFGASADLTWDDSTKRVILNVAGTGSTYLTLQNGGVSGSWGAFRSAGQDFIALGFNGLPTNTSNSIFYKAAIGAVTLAATDSFGITISDGGYGGGVAVSELYPITSGVTEIGRNTAPFGTIRTKGSLVLQQTGAGTSSITLTAPAAVTAYSLTMPSAQGAASTVLTNNGSGTLTWDNPGTGTITQSVYTVGTASGTYTGSTTLFNLPFAYVQDSKSLMVFYNGQVMISGLDYAETSTTSVTFTSALVVGGKVVLRSITPSTPANTSVAQYQNYVVGTPSGPYSGSTTVYALPFAYTQDGKSLWVYYDGVRLTPGDDYTETTTTSITTTSALVVGRKVAFSTISAAGTAAAVTNLRENYVVGTASGSYTGSTTVFNLLNTYTPGGINLAVFLDGDLQTVGASIDYLETSGTVVTFNNSLVVGQKVTFLFSQSVAAAGTVSSATSGQIAYYPSTGSTITGSTIASISTNGVDINGSLGLSVVTTASASYTALASDYTILGNAASNAITVNLPTAASSTRRIYVIKKTDSSLNDVTIDANGSETIDGALTYVLTAQWESVTLQSNGTSWFVL